MAITKINILCITFSICVLSVFVHSRPGVRSGVKACEGQVCPNNTFACAVLTKINPDNATQLLSTIQCLGLHDEVLQNTTVTSKNPFPPGVHFQGYKYTGVFEFSSQNEHEPAPTRNPNAEPLGDDDDNEIESN